MQDKLSKKIESVIKEYSETVNTQLVMITEQGDIRLRTNYQFSSKELYILKSSLEKEFDINIYNLMIKRVKKKYISYVGAKYILDISIITSEYINQIIKNIKYYIDDKMKTNKKDSEICYLLNIIKYQKNNNVSFKIDSISRKYLKIAENNISIYICIFREIFNCISTKHCIHIRYTYKSDDSLEIFPVYI